MRKCAVTAHLLVLKREKREAPMKRNPMPVVSLLDTGKIFFAVFCCALLMLFAAPAWADPCSAPTVPAGAAPTGTVDLAVDTCTVLITITGTTGNLTATIATPNPAFPNYDGSDDQLVGIQNNSSVTIGAIRLSAPPPGEDNLFEFDGDGPCDTALPSPGYPWCPNPYPAVENDPNPVGYEGPDNIFVGISPDQTTGTVLFSTPIPGAPAAGEPGGSTWFGLENAPAAVVSIGETQPVTSVTNVFPFGPFVCTSDGVCTAGNGTWTEQVYGDDAQFTFLNLTGPASWTVFPIPVPAAPLGVADVFGSFMIGGITEFGPGQYGIETPGPTPYGPPAFSSVNYPNLACIAYTDFSWAAALQFGYPQPTCVEIERDFIGNATDAANGTWTGQLDYDIDADSLPALIGGPHVLWDSNGNDHGPTSPPNTDFNTDALYAYTGASPVLEADLPLDGGPPPKTSGTPPKSIFVSAFDPVLSETKPIAAGFTIGPSGFQKPVINTSTPSCSPNAPVNCILDLVPVGLSWSQTDLSGNPINNLHLCLNVSGGVCTTKGVTTPWVYLSSIPATGCPAGFAGQKPLLGVLLNLSTPKNPGEYIFAWEPGIEPNGCEVRVVVEYGNPGPNGTTILSRQAPAVFEYTSKIFVGEL